MNVCYHVFFNCIGHYYADNFITKEQQTLMEDWLKSLKDRVQPQPKQEWSEEDNQYLCGLIGLVEQSKAGLPITLKGKAADNCIDWLNSLRPHKQWKPSEEQIDVLSKACIYYKDSWVSKDNEILNTLLYDLKAL